MRLLLFLVYFVSLVFGYDENILKQSKIDIFNAQKDMVFLKQKSQNYSLLAKPVISYQIQEVSPTSNDAKNSFLNIRIEQDIFKSGGNYYSIKQASSLSEASLQRLNINKRMDVFKAYKIAIGIKKLDLSIQKQNLLVQNKKQTIKVIEDKYKSGISGISVLGNAFIELNTLENALHALVSSKESMLGNLLSFSDMSYEDIKIWDLDDSIDKDLFIKNNNNIAISKLNIVSKEYIAKSTITKYLPKVSLFANYTDIGDQTTYGVKVSMTLNAGAISDVSYAKLDIVKDSLGQENTIEYESNIFSSIKKEIHILDNKIQNIKNNLDYYRLLVKDISDKYKQKLVSKTDRDIIINTEKMTKLDRDIFMLDRHLKIAELHERFSDGF